MINAVGVSESESDTRDHHHPVIVSSVLMLVARTCYPA
jgi:hypothetical protein